MYFQYDTNDLPLGFVYNEVQYFYVANTMGDVIGITEANGNLIAQYLYDDWGKLVSIDTADAEGETACLELANANPLRYRGYYFDSETGYYYLQSRYYAPEICRFINADNADIAKDLKNKEIGINVFAYCLNNPSNSFDLNGHITVSLKNKKLSNMIVKFAAKISNSWTFSSSVQSKQKFKFSKLGVTLYIGASASTSVSAMKNKTSSYNNSVQISSKCSLSFGKRKLSFSSSTTINGNTVKGTVTLGSNSIAYGVSVITRYYYNSRSSCYFSIDIGFSIKHITTAAATAVVAGVCIAVPYIAPAATKIYCSILSSIASYKAFISGLAAIASASMTIAKQFA